MAWWPADFVASYDMLGQGQSDKPRLFIEQSDQVEVLRDLIASLGPRPVFIGGIQLRGGVIALRYAIEHPGTIAGLVPMSSFAEMPPQLMRLGTALAEHVIAGNTKSAGHQAIAKRHPHLDVL